MNKFEVWNLVQAVIDCGGDYSDQTPHIIRIENAINGFSDNPKVLGWLRDAIDSKLVYTGFYDYSHWRKDLFEMIDNKLEPPIHKATSLAELFEHTSKYHKVMDLLVKQKKVTANTYKWKDLNNGYKSCLAFLVFDLQQKGYFKSSSMLNSDQKRTIIKNTFGADVSVSTIKHADCDSNEFAFIPTASALK